MTELSELEDRPDKVIRGSLKPLRFMIRGIRMLSHKVRLHKKLTLGTNVFFARSCYLAPPEFMRVGNNVAIGQCAFVETNLEIGDDVLISSHVSFVGNDHRFDNPAQSVYWSGRLPPSTVVLEGDNLIGHKSTVIGNVRIGKGCIVGACSVVTKDLPPNTICCGVPARPLRDRFKSLTTLENPHE